MSISLQKADMWKRISAWLFDLMLVLVATVASSLVFLSAFDYDEKLVLIEQTRERYEQEFGIDLDITQDEYNAFSPEEKQSYDDVYQALNNALAEDKELTSAYAKLILTVIFAISLGLLIGNAVVYFVFPMIFKNGQTLGKKCFGLAVVRSNSVKLTTPVLFVRCFIGRFAIETMFPMFLVAMILLGALGSVGTITLVLFLLLQVGVMIYSPTNSSIHDLLSDSVVVDMASQAIFQNNDELVEYQKAEALRKANETENV